jgi:hypothetical protein
LSGAAAVTLYLDVAKTGEGGVLATMPMLFSVVESCDVGSDTASSVSDDDMPENSRFSGSIKCVQIDTVKAAENLDRLITPEDRLKIAMTRTRRGLSWFTLAG